MTATPRSLLPPDTRPDYLPPRAFMGYAVHNRRLVVRVCAWCPDKREAEDWARAKGTPVTHGCCPSCAAEMRKQLTGSE